MSNSFENGRRLSNLTTSSRSSGSMGFEPITAADGTQRAANSDAAGRQSALALWLSMGILVVDRKTGRGILWGIP